MNPYLERATAWESFHPNFISAAHFRIAEQLPAEYVVRIENKIYIHEPPHYRRFLGSADVGVGHPTTGTANSAVISATLDAPARMTILEPIEIIRVGFLTIRDRDNNDLICVIELLSPTNKYAGPDREQYMGKRREVLRSKAHFIEIDLLRGGPRISTEQTHACDYCAIVSPVEERPIAGVWPWQIRDTMPILPVPLRCSHPSARLDMKSLIDQVYDGGRYANYIYSGPPEPRLSAADAAWAAQFVPSPT